MSRMQRPLVGWAMGISVSESDDSVEHGFPQWQVNRATLQIVAALLGQGVGVIFGHDWRDDGVMEAVHGLARQIEPPAPPSPRDGQIANPRLLRNLLPWPDAPRLSDLDQERLSSTLLVESAGLPEELLSVDQEAIQAGRGSPLYQYVRARGLTFLRHRLDEVCDGRLCLGGRIAGYEGRYPGVIEEALLAVRSGKPLYLSGIFGGATQQVVDAIEGKDMPDAFCPPTAVHSLYDHPPVSERDRTTMPDRRVERLEVWSELARGRAQIIGANGLTPSENEEMARSSVLERVIQLVLTGLSRLRRTQGG